MSATEDFLETAKLVLKVSTVLEFPLLGPNFPTRILTGRILRILPFPMLGDLGESIYTAAYRINVINQWLPSLHRKG